MLKQLRNKKTAKKIWILLAILILPAFVLWGAGSIDKGKNKNESGYIGKIYGRKIPYSEYKDALEAVKIQAIMRFGEDLSQIQKYLDLQTQAWERLILLAEAKKRRIKTSDKEVVELIENYQFFQRNGRFDNKIYNEMLKYAFRIQPRTFEEQARQNIMLSNLYKTVTDGTNLAPQDIKNEYIKANQQLSLYYIAAMPADFIKEVNATDQEIKNYYLNNQLEFKQPLSFNLEYVSSDSEEKIKKLLPVINKKNALNKLAKDNGLSIKETGLFQETAPIPGIGWEPKIINLVSGLKPGEHIKPIKMDKTYYLIWLKERKEPFIPEFEKINDEVKAVFLKKASEKIAKTKIEACLENLKRDSQKKIPADFNKLAKKIGLKSNQTEPFKFGSYIEGIGASDSFWLKAKELKENDFSDILSLPAGFYIIKLKSISPVDDKKFSEEKDKFAEQLLLQKKEDIFSAFIEGLKQKAQRF